MLTYTGVDHDLPWSSDARIQYFSVNDVKG